MGAELLFCFFVAAGIIIDNRSTPGDIFIFIFCFFKRLVKAASCIFSRGPRYHVYKLTWYNFYTNNILTNNTNYINYVITDSAIIIFPSVM